MRVSFKSAPRALVLGAALAFILAGGLPAAAKVLATVNGVDITDDDVKVAMEDIGPTLPQMQPAERATYVLNYLIDSKLVAREAEKEKLGDTPEFARRLAYFHDKVLMETLLGNVAKAAATDDALKKTYDEAAKMQKPEEEIHARHILVATEDEAKAALKRVQAGEDFAKVATELSKDPGSEGGDLGWFTKDRMVPEFAEAAFKLKPGEISQPIKTQFGWHIIKVEERRMKPFPTFDQVKDQVLRYVVQKAQGELIAKLRADAKIVRAEPEPKPDANPATPPDAAPGATPAPSTPPAPPADAAPAPKP
jgi:peptidyl-prolyl cis-trans isomerase C